MGPWGKMQPIRHALAGLLLEQNQLDESEEVYREDLKKHPRNPWSLTGLINCLRKRIDATKKTSSCCHSSVGAEDAKKNEVLREEIDLLQAQLQEQRKCEWADFDISVSCECCGHIKADLPTTKVN